MARRPLPDAVCIPMRSQRWLRHHVQQILYWPLSRPVERPRLPPALRKRLRAIFQPDVERLREVTRLALETWPPDAEPKARRSPARHRGTASGLPRSPPLQE